MAPNKNLLLKNSFDARGKEGLRYLFKVTEGPPARRGALESKKRYPNPSLSFNFDSQISMKRRLSCETI